MSKILYVASTYSHIKSFHLDYIEALKAAGHEVLVMARGEEADFDIPFEKKLFSAKNSSCRRKIKKIIKSEGFDVILLNTTLAAFHVRMACPGKMRPRVVNFVHGYLFSKESGFLRRKLFLLCEKLMRKKTDAIIVMNEEDRAIAEKHKLTKGKIYFTRGMGVKYKSAESTREFIREREEASDKFVMTYVGELSGRKNQRDLVEALSIIKPQVPEAVLWLVGEGDSRGELEVMLREYSLRDSVKLFGRREDVADLLLATDVYVSAAKSEGLPFNIVEALSHRKNVVASDVKGQSDIIENGKSGFLYALSDVKALANLVLEIKAARLSLSEDEIFERYQKFSFENVFSETVSIVSEALSL